MMRASSESLSTLMAGLAIGAARVRLAQGLAPQLERSPKLCPQNCLKMPTWNIAEAYKVAWKLLEVAAKLIEVLKSNFLIVLP